MTGVQRYPTPVPSGGDVDGPASATDNALARYDGTTGKLLQDSSVSVTDAGKLQLIASGSASAGINIAPGSAPSSPVNGDIWTTTSGVYARINGVTQGPFESAAGSYQPASGDLTAIDALAGTSGFLKKTATDTWALDTNTYLTGNQSITVSGDATGSGTTSIALTLANSGVSAGTYNNNAAQVRPFTVDAKGRVTSIGAAVNIAIPQSAVTNLTTDLSGKSPLAGSSSIQTVGTIYTGNWNAGPVTSRYFYQWANGEPTSNLGSPTVSEMALFDSQFNNKLWFYDPTKFTFTYTMNGTDWITQSNSTSEIKNLVGGAGATGSNISIPNLAQKYRIDIRNDGTYVYTNALYMYFSTNSHQTKVHIWKKRDDGSWTQVTSSNTNVSSWPGHLYLPFDTIPWSTSLTGGHYNDIRIEFTPTWTTGGSYDYTNISLINLEIWGGYPAGRRTIYNWDSDKNVTFPAALTATTTISGSGLAGSLLSSTNPLMDGAVAVGTSAIPSRQDHVHPVDTSRSPVAGSSSITTVGTIGSGTWQGSVVAGQYGGTGVANTGKTITVSGNTTIGSSTHTVAFATSGNTSVTLPTSGTLEVTGHTHAYQPIDADLTAIAALAGTSGLLKKTAADTWTLDTTAYTTNTGTVTSVGMTVPTGLSISGSPITTSGTLALTLTAGYSIPTTASQTNWDTAYTDRNKWDGGATGLVAATGRTSLGGTTVGQNLFTLTNPTAVTFLRVNADNTVSTLDAATFRSAIGAGTSSTTGTVTSVGMTVPTGLSISGSPVTTSGTLALTLTAGYEIPTTAALAAKAPLASPTFTGTVTANTIVPSSGYLALNYGTGAFDAVRSGQLQVLRDGVGDWNTLFAAYGTAAEVAADTPRFAVWGIGAFEATYEGKISNSSNAYLKIEGGAGYERQVQFRTGSSLRWTFGATVAAETGSNAGSAFSIARYSDAGAWVDNPFEIDRATGTVYANDGMAAAAPGTFNSFVAGSTSNVGAGILDGSFVANRDSHAIMYLLAQGSSGIAARIRGWVAGGTAASKTVPTASSLLLSIDARGWGGTGYRGGSGIEFSLGTGTFSDTSMPGKIEFQTVPDGSVNRQTRLTIDQNGLATFANDVLVSGTSKLYLGNATGGFKGEIRSQSNYPVVLMPYDNSGNALGSAEFYYSTAGNTWNSEVGLNVGGALTVFNSSGANSISLSSTSGDSLVNIQAGGASGNYGYLRLRSRWGQADQNELHSGIGSDGSWFVSQKTINGSAVTRDNILYISSAGNVTFNPVSTITVNGTPTFTGKITTASPTTSIASLNLPHGSAPTSPANGDVWSSTSGVYARVNSETKLMTDNSGYKNRMINGSFEINQRGATSTTADLSYVFDRWFLNRSGGTATYSSQTGTIGNLTDNFVTHARIVTASQSAAGDFALLAQALDGVHNLAGKTVTVSFWAKAGSGTPKIAVEWSQVFGTGGSAAVNTYGGQVTLSTSWVRYSVTMSIPSVTSKTLGSTVHYGQLNLWTSAGTTYSSRTGTLGVQNTTIDIWGVQVEDNPIATSYEYRPAAIELLLCQRYYYRINSSEGGLYTNFVYTRQDTATVAYGVIHLPVKMRRNQTLENSALSTFLYNEGTGAVQPSGLAIDMANQMSPSISVTYATGGRTVGRAGTLYANNTSSAYIALNAEVI